MEGDVSAAVRVVVSEDSVVCPSEEVLAALRLKHPDAPSDLRAVPANVAAVCHHTCHLL